ncbi:hypothetical protein QQF92_00175 [Melissococcus plutonius]
MYTERIAIALESISESLSSLAEDTKTNCELKKSLWLVYIN